MSLATRIPTVYQHTQDAASAAWVIEHNLNAYPVVDIYVDYEGEKHRILPSDVVYTDANTCTIVFTTPYTGFAAVA